MKRLMTCLLVFLHAGSAHAQEQRFQLQTLDYGARESSMFGVSSSRLGQHLEPNTDLVFEYASNPLQPAEQSLVQDRLAIDLGFAVPLWRRLQLDVRGSAILYQSGTLADDTGLDPFAFGDVRLGGTVRLLRPDSPFGLGLRTVLWVPTGSPTGFASDDVVRVEPRLVADYETGPIEIVANVGYQVRASRDVADYRSDDLLRWGAAARWDIAGGFGLDAALFGAHSIFSTAPNASSADANPVEAMGGVWWSIGGFTATVGAGRGLNPGVGAPDLRVLASLAYRPGERADWARQRQPAVASRVATGRRGSSGGTGGTGADGVPPDQDQCPFEAEDVDGFEDDDGCPDSDNDQDGVSDFEDACPDVAGIAGKGGCPVVDADGDGVDDAEDACLDAAEDIDEFEDDDGCPDPDNDADGIADAVDACPLEAEVVNGNDDDDGCPDEGESLVSVQDDRIEILERVYFDNDRATIKQRSYSVLEQVASVLKSHPEIELLAIEGHTDSRGGAAHNRELSARRARAVREFLQTQGIDAERLRHRGYGVSHPIADNSTSEGRAINRRVEFLIVRRSAAKEKSP